MSTSTKTTTPEVLWAQRSSESSPEKNYIYLTISAPDAPKIDVDLKSTSLTFTGHSDTKNTRYHVELELYGEIDTENSKTHHTSRGVEFVLRKKELKSEYWPRLLKESKRVHFLKTDFDKWVDEDEQDGVVEDDPTGGMGGMEGMGGLGGDGGFGGLDFSKLGGGAGGAGGFGGGEGADDLDDDDDDMPDLEDDGAAADKDADEKIVIGKPEEKTVIGDAKPSEGKSEAPASTSKKIEVVE
ncbi:hypothetical protein MMC31_006603 [Peltigera leucophlebia]|nr:hypothetical protein [Peltigera leucophlebia]